MCLSQGMVVITPGSQLNPYFLVSFLNGPARKRALELAVGSAHPHLNLKDIRQFDVPVPALVEQERIVAKVEELMQLCDTLEAHQQARRARHRPPPRLVLDALTTAESDDDLHTAWSRIHTHWEALVGHPDGIGILRDSILKTAVRGTSSPNAKPTAVPQRFSRSFNVTRRVANARE